MKKLYKDLRRHLITGFIFLMPVLIGIAVISKFWETVKTIGNKVSKFLYIDALLGPAGDVIVTLLLLLVFCVLAGFLVKFTILKKMSEWVDDKVANFIPGYNEFKKATVHKMRKVPAEQIFETCLVRTHGCWKPAYIIERAWNGDITVFMPFAPGFTMGQVAIFPEGSYKKLSMDSRTLNMCLKRFGKGISLP